MPPLTSDATSARSGVDSGPKDAPTLEDVHKNRTATVKSLLDWLTNQAGPTATNDAGLSFTSKQFLDIDYRLASTDLSEFSTTKESPPNIKVSDTLTYQSTPGTILNIMDSFLDNFNVNHVSVSEQSVTQTYAISLGEQDSQEYKHNPLSDDISALTKIFTNNDTHVNITFINVTQSLTTIGSIENAQESIKESTSLDVFEDREYLTSALEDQLLHNNSRVILDFPEYTGLAHTPLTASQHDLVSLVKGGNLTEDFDALFLLPVGSYNLVWLLPVVILCSFIFCCLLYICVGRVKGLERKLSTWLNATVGRNSVFFLGGSSARQDEETDALTTNMAQSQHFELREPSSQSLLSFGVERPRDRHAYDEPWTGYHSNISRQENCHLLL